MATTKNLSFHDRVRFALRNYAPDERDFAKICVEMKKEDPNVELLSPREFGAHARMAMGKVWT